jgi:hypothetical protein
MSPAQIQLLPCPVRRPLARYVLMRPVWAPPLSIQGAHWESAAIRTHQRKPVAKERFPTRKPQRAHQN